MVQRKTIDASFFFAPLRLCVRKVSRKGAKAQRKLSITCCCLFFILFCFSFNAPVTARSAVQSSALASVNERVITLDDLDPRVRELVNRLEGEIAETRRRVLEEHIALALFDAEAKKRGITVPRLLDLMVTRRVVNPTAEEVRSLYEANRAQFGAADLEAARPQIIAYVRQENQRKLIEELATRLRKQYPVVMGTDVNAPNLAPNARLATAAGRVITAAPVIERLKPIIYDMRLNVYQVLKKAVEQMVYDILVLNEAARQGIGPEIIIRTEITDKLHNPSEEEIAQFYEENKARLNSDLASMRIQIANYLAQQEQVRLEKTLREKLSARANVRMMLMEPEAPPLAVSTDDDPSRGIASAPVTVVVFTDFQCPSCSAHHTMIDETTRTYGTRVRLVIRDFPLQMHEFAFKAAEAANAANAQGKFFEYTELLYKNQKALDVPSLKKYASEAGLNRARFDAALDSGAYALEVKHDMAEGVQYGVSGTPTVFVNGVKINELSAETLRAAIDRALARKNAAGTNAAPPTPPRKSR